MRECGECTKCCEWLKGEAYGHSFDIGKPCNFMGNGCCTIYDIRPERPCRTYFCAWAQELFPEWMRPDKCGAIISVEQAKEDGEHDTNFVKGEQFLRVISPNGISKEVEEECKKFYEQHKCKVIV